MTSLAWILSTASVLAQVAPPGEDPRSAAKLVKEGNTLLAEGNYAEALAAYDQAAKFLPDSPEVAYNRGVALYRMEEYAQAEPTLQNALKPGNPELEANAKYNLGRCAHAAALKQQENPEAAINDLSRAIRFYQGALQIAPEDQDASKNRDLAVRLKTFLERRLEQQEQQQPSSQPTSLPTSQPDQQPTSQPTSQPQQGDQEQDQQGESDQEQDQQDEGRPDQDGKQDEKGEGQNKQKQSEQDPAEDEEQREMTQEQAEKFLQEARDKERERREEKRLQAMRLHGRIPVEKDW